MRKNTASQHVAFQMVSATDGSAVTTGTPTVYYTIDGGTQGTGSGTAAHEGNGCWSYAPAQAETNGNHVVFTMALSGAISQSVNVYPVGYDETSASLGLNDPTAAAIRAEIDSNSTQLAAIVEDTNELQADWANGGRLDLIVDAILADTAELQTNQGNWLTATGFSTHGAADVVTAMQAVAADFKADVSGLALESTLTTIAGYLDTEIAAILEDTGTTLPAQISGLSIPTAAQIRSEIDSNSTQLAAILEDTGTTLPATLATIDTLLDRLAPILVGTNTGGGTGTEVFAYGGVTATVTVDENGNRSAVVFS